MHELRKSVNIGDQSMNMATDRNCDYKLISGIYRITLFVRFCIFDIYAFYILGEILLAHKSHL